LAGCDHKTVARLVAAREAAGGGLTERARSRPLVDPFAEKIDEFVDRSRAQIRADKAHAILVAMGYEGSYRTTRRAVADAKRRWRQRHGRRTRPWIPQPGLWLQWDYGDGPEVAGARAVLFCAWLAWSRFRVVVPLRDKTLASVVIGLDRTLRMVGAVPTYALTDNEKTVTVEHVCGIAVRNATIVAVSAVSLEKGDRARGRRDPRGRTAPRNPSVNKAAGNNHRNDDGRWLAPGQTGTRYPGGLRSGACRSRRYIGIRIPNGRERGASGGQRPMARSAPTLQFVIGADDNRAIPTVALCCSASANADESFATEVIAEPLDAPDECNGDERRVATWDFFES